MHFRHFLFSIFAITLLSGCSSRSKGFFEDIYSATEVRSATSQDYSNVKSARNAPIIVEEKSYDEARAETKKSSRYIDNSSQVYHASGKIVDVSYDRDVNLYVYAFVKSGTSNSITFYSDEDLKPIDRTFTITVKDNFLTSHTVNNPSNNSQRTDTKRKRSRIKAPIIEKINTL